MIQLLIRSILRQYLTVHQTHDGFLSDSRQETKLANLFTLIMMELVIKKTISTLALSTVYQTNI